jgi:hypothetical protein
VAAQEKINNEEQLKGVDGVLKAIENQIGQHGTA